MLCLDVWKGQKNGGPYMHSIHFSFAIGCFMAPLLAEPFLSNKQSVDENYKNSVFFNSTSEVNDTHVQSNDGSNRTYDTSGMVILYPIVGVIALLTSIGYLSYGIIDLKQMKRLKKRDQKPDVQIYNINAKVNNSSTSNGEFLKLLLVILLLAFIFLYVGMEVMYGTFVTTFAVQSDLNLTRQEGARINAIFWGSFAAMRFAAIFIAFKFNALSQMVLSFTLCTFGSIVLAIVGNVYKYVLCIGSAFMGTGMASVYACGILWIEKHITVTNRIVSCMIISGSLGADLFPIILGQIIATFPMILMYLQVAVVVMCILLFSTAYVITRIMTQNNNKNIPTDNEELQTLSCS